MFRRARLCPREPSEARRVRRGLARPMLIGPVVRRLVACARAAIGDNPGSASRHMGAPQGVEHARWRPDPPRGGPARFVDWAILAGALTPARHPPRPHAMRSRSRFPHPSGCARRRRGSRPRSPARASTSRAHDTACGSPPIPLPASRLGLADRDQLTDRRTPPATSPTAVASRSRPRPRSPRPRASRSRPCRRRGSRRRARARPGA